MCFVNKTIDQLNTKYVLIGLNPAKQDGLVMSKHKLENFHSSYAYQKDYKLCIALKGTPLWGSYITDLFKSVTETDSAIVFEILKAQNTEEFDINMLLNELSYLDNDVILFALGRKVEKRLRKLLGNKYRIIYLQHYSSWIGPQSYKKKVDSILKKECIFWFETSP